jgi:hypothetical protein
VTVEKLSRRNSRLVPRATKSAVSDWRPSCGARDLSDGNSGSLIETRTQAIIAEETCASHALSSDKIIADFSE